MRKLKVQNKRMKPYLEWLLRVNPETRVMKRELIDNKFKCTKWIKLRLWDFKIRGDPTDREVLPNELIFETDLPNPEENKAIAQILMNRLKAEGFSFECWYSGNKSYPIYTYWKDLDLFDKDIISIIREVIARHIAGDLYDILDDNFIKKSSQMILIKGAKHPKSNKYKILYRSYHRYKLNKIPIQILENIKYYKDMIRLSKDDLSRYIHIINKLNSRREIKSVSDCGILRLAMERKFPEGQRNRVLAPNFMALDPEEWQIRKLAQVQEMSLTDIVGWRRAGCFRKYFSCGQVRKYAESLGLGEICKKCFNSRKKGEK